MTTTAADWSWYVPLIPKDEWADYSLDLDDGTFGLDFRTIMDLLLLSILVVGVAAQNPMTQSPTTAQNQMSNCTLTVQMVDQVIQRLRAEPQYVPSYILDPIVSATQQEKQQFVDFVNDLMTGKFANITVDNFQQFTQLIQQRAPLIYQKGLGMYSALMAKVNALNPEAKAFVLKWLDKWANVIQSMPMGNAFQLSFEFNRGFFTDAEKLSPDALNSLKQQFPEFAKLWEDCPQLKQFADFMVNAPNDMDVTKLEAMQQYMASMTTPSPLMA
ncbi:hypothetical protein TELCIR_05928 [Teladorsagia circumcincta]|uniref:Fatty-acid and retinol-binding protein 1 n=1 Tax=Teladorsagia circumcincta TaxID=45464 RepID=A0A2G9UPH0_TELCI|nr:hypothetical protein TELCIR_05928 [Teladorsagia circumcincta]